MYSEKFWSVLLQTVVQLLKNSWRIPNGFQQEFFQHSNRNFVVLEQTATLGYSSNSKNEIYKGINWDRKLPNFDIILDMKYLPMHRSMASSPTSTSVRSSHQQHSGRFCMILSKKYQAFLSSKSLKSDWIASNNRHQKRSFCHLILWFINYIMKYWS